MSETAKSGDDDAQTWVESLANRTYDIPDDVDVTKENCRELVDYWVRLGGAETQEDGSYSRDAGRGIHVPIPGLDDEEQPLCRSRGDGNWERKELEVYPPPWDQDKLCDKCLSILQGEDYMDGQRGKIGD